MSFQEYVSKRIALLVFYGDVIYKLDNAKRGIPSQGAKLTLTFDPVTQNQ